MDAMSCLAPLPFLSGPAAYADAAIASALRFSSMSSDSSSSSSSSCYAPLNLFASAPAPQPVLTTTCCDSVLVSHSAARGTGKQGSRLGAAGGRAGKRRARASKRAPTTYISTDPANFRLMVQHITGVQADPTAAFDVVVDAPGAVLLVDDAPVFGAGHPLLPSADDVDAAAFLQQQQQQQQYQQRQQEPCFPTLDSWSVMYESSELAAALISTEQQ